MNPDLAEGKAAPESPAPKPSGMRLYTSRDQRLVALDRNPERVSEAIWIDVLRPSPEDEAYLEKALGVDIPTQEEMREIEVSSRLYVDGGDAFMTAMVLSHSDGDDVIISPITFILSGTRLITVRYEEPRVFATFPERAQRTAIGCTDAESVLVGLLDAVIDRLADILERVAVEIDGLSRDIFRPARPGKKRDRKPRTTEDYQRILEAIGRKYDITSNIRDSLVTLERFASFFLNVAQQRKTSKELNARIKSFARDTDALSEHVDSVSQKVTFLLDATLGMVNIEQNAIIKIFSVAATIFLPPTLIASIYGMNFDFMPELAWPFGYPFAVGLMIAFAILPYLFFKRKGWL